MNLRPKTVRRLTVLLAGVAVLFAVGAALYLRNEHNKAAKLASARAAGMAAFKAGDYRGTLEALKFYVARNKTDPEALLAYGTARSRIEEPNGRHISEGIFVFNTLLGIDPNNLQAKHDLLDLYTQAFYSSEAIDLADRVLAQQRDDQAALHAKAIALERQHKYDKALETSERLNQLDPTDLEQQFTTYRLMLNLKRPAAELLERARKQQESHPNDPRFELIAAWVYGITGDVARGTELLRTAATRPAPDATFVRKMVRGLDSLRMYKEAQELLDRAVAQKSDPLVMRVLVQRLWQNGRMDQVLQRLKDLDPASPNSDTTLLAYRALALYQSNKSEDANRIITALSHRSGDTDAVAWSSALSAWMSGMEPKAALAQYQAALIRSPDNSVIRYFVGDAYLRLGENELAIDAWRRAADLSPSWALPHVQIARTLSATGRHKEAIDEARAAIRSAPTQIGPRITLTMIEFRQLERSAGGPNAGDVAQLLSKVSEIQKIAPNEPETLPLYVTLLARAGRKDQAIAAARAAMKNPHGVDQATLLRLVAASRAEKLGLEDELSAASDESDSSPRLVLSRAAELAAAGKISDGLALLQKNARAATTQPVQWQLAINQYREMTGDVTVSRDWIDLAEANPRNLSVQTSILKLAHSTRADRQFIAHTIDRVKALTGPEGQTWKIERARWLITGENKEKDSAEAVNILNEVVRVSPDLAEPRMLLAQAYDNVGNLAAASKELAAAALLEPKNVQIALDAARVLQMQGRFGDARAHLERVSASAELTLEQRRRTAAMLAQQSDFTKAAKTLESSPKALDVPGDLLLAEIYRRQGRAAEAQIIYSQLLARQPLDFEAVQAAADFYASQQKLDDARKTLSRLAHTNASPLLRELVWAAFEERYGSSSEAARYYAAATQPAPSAAPDARAWRNWIAFQLRSGRYEQARQSSEDAAKAAPNDATLQRFKTSASALSELAKKNAALLPMLHTFAVTTDDPAMAEFLASAGDAAAPATPDALLGKLRDSAQRHPRSLAIQSALVQWHVAMKQLDEAGKVAGAMMELFPDADSARLATQVYGMTGKWDLTAAAAQKWRDRSQDHPMEADCALAEAKLMLNDGPAAVKLISPYLAQASADPEKYDSVLATCVRAYAAAGDAKAARILLEPLWPRSRHWREVGLALAGNELRDAASATDWIKQIAAQIAGENEPAQRLALANAWYNLAARLHTPGALESAEKCLAGIADRPDAPVQAIVMRAAIAERRGDANSAEAFYRQAIKNDPQQREALNNLAYLILLRDDGDLREARILAARAVELAPSSSSFYDTLARIQYKTGDRDGALISFQKALRLDPNNLDALIGMATSLSTAGKHENAASILTQIDNLLKANPPLSDPVRRELDALRATIKTSI